MRVQGMVIAIAMTAVIGSQGVAQQSAPSAASSIGHMASRFVPVGVWQRMLERPEDAPEALVVGVDQDVAWAALEGTFKDLGIPVKFSEKTAGEIGMVHEKLYKRMGKYPLSRFLRCGEGTAGPNAEMYVVYVSVLGFVRPTADGQRLLYALITGDAVDLPNGRNEVMQCTSSGQFEMLVVKALAKRLLIKEPGS